MQITAEKVARSFPTRGEPLVILRDVNFELDSGGILVVMGPSGSGKSTLLQILGTLDRPSSGRVLFGGEDPWQLAEQEQARFRRERMGFVFQEHRLLPHLTTRENVLVPCLAAGKVSMPMYQRADRLLDRVGLGARHHHFPSELSGGERQRAAVARALIQRPAILLADEPTGSLDGPTAAQVADLLWELHREEGLTMIIVTHSEQLAHRSPRIQRLLEGRLV